MKIFQVTPSLRTGGAETLVKNYCLKLREKNEVKCVVMGRCVKGEPNKIALDSAGVPITYMWNDIKRAHLLSKIWGRISMYWKLPFMIYKEKPDVVHCHLVCFQYILLPLMCFHKCKFFYTLHSTIPKTFVTRWNFFLAKLLNRIHWVQFITLHQAMEEDFERLLPGKKGIILRNGIDMSRYEVSEDTRCNYREILGIDCNDFVVGHVGSLSPVKNHFFLLKVFREVKSIHKNSRLLLVGSGDIEAEIMSEAERLGVLNDIIWLKNRADIPELLSVMDVFVFPSLSEGFPLAVLEAQAAGLRCIISDKITDEILLTDNICKMNIDEAPKKWAREVLCSSNHIKHRGLEEYDLNHVIEKLMDIYEGRIVS